MSPWPCPGPWPTGGGLWTCNAWMDRSLVHCSCLFVSLGSTIWQIPAVPGGAWRIGHWPQIDPKSSYFNEGKWWSPMGIWDSWDTCWGLSAALFDMFHVPRGESQSKKQLRIVYDATRQVTGCPKIRVPSSHHGFQCWNGLTLMILGGTSILGNLHTYIRI